MFDPGSDQEVTLADGRTLVVGRLEVRHLRAFRNWVAERVGDPFASLEKFIDRLPPAVALEKLKEAESVRDQLRFFSLAAPLAQQALATEEGAAFLFRQLLRPAVAGKEATEDDALAVFLHFGKEAAAAVLARAQGDSEGNAAAPA